MKQFLLFLFYIPQLLLAQSNWCGTADRMLGEIPSEQDLMQVIRNNIQNKSGDSLLIIPTVVHIVHHNGNGDISDLQVLDGMRVINEDFRRTNSDTINGNPIFFLLQGIVKLNSDWQNWILMAIPLQGLLERTLLYTHIQNQQMLVLTM